MSQLDRDREKSLDIYIHDYLVKRNFQSTAITFKAERNIPSNEIPAIDAPGGFLSEWWSIFWDVYISKTSNKNQPAAGSPCIKNQKMDQNLQQYHLLQRRRRRQQSRGGGLPLNIATGPYQRNSNLNLRGGPSTGLGQFRASGLQQPQLPVQPPQYLNQLQLQQQSQPLMQPPQLLNQPHLQQQPQSLMRPPQHLNQQPQWQQQLVPKTAQNLVALNVDKLQSKPTMPPNNQCILAPDSIQHPVPNPTFENLGQQLQQLMCLWQDGSVKPDVAMAIDEDEKKASFNEFAAIHRQIRREEMLKSESAKTSSTPNAAKTSTAGSADTPSESANTFTSETTVES